MSKEKLQEIIIENFVQNNIEFDKFIELTEKVKQISEIKAEKVINEIWGKVAVGAAAAGLFGLAIWRSLKVQKMNADKDYRRCIKNVENTLGKQFERMDDAYRKSKEVYRHPDGTKTIKYNEYARKKLADAEDRYNEAIRKCEELYDKKIDIINRKKKEVRIKYKAQQSKKKG
jgi:hypothetical protein